MLRNPIIVFVRLHRELYFKTSKAISLRNTLVDIAIRVMSVLANNFGIPWLLLRSIQL